MLVCSTEKPDNFYFYLFFAATLCAAAAFLALSAATATMAATTARCRAIHAATVS